MSQILINDTAPNVFQRLLSYRPRPDRDSKENFLTEAFAYVLAQDPKVAAKIIEGFTAGGVRVKRLVSITTQVRLADGRGLLDMKIEVLDQGDQPVQVWIENKWDSPADYGQLVGYLKFLETLEPAIPKHLVLLTPRHADALDLPESKSGVRLTHMTWSKIHEVVTAHQAHAITKELEAFLSMQRLSVRPIMLQEAREHYLKLRAKDDSRGREFLQNLEELCGRALNILSKRELSKDVELHAGYGRIGLWMFDKRVTLGVLYDPTDHSTAFLDDERPLDLVVRVEGDYKQVEAQPVRKELQSLVSALERIGYACDQGRWRTNRHTVLLGHHREGFPFDVATDEQIRRVSQVFEKTLNVLEGSSGIMRLLGSVREY